MLLLNYFIIVIIIKMIEQCNICIEDFSKQKRKSIKCEYCEFTACKECFEKWILTENVAKCMNNDCNREWTANFIANNFAANFITTKLKKHKENVLFDKERALLPSTQPIVENMIQAKKIDDIIADELYPQLREINRKIRNLRLERDDLLHRKNAKRERSLFVKACPREECRGFLSSQWKCGICEYWTCPECHVVKGLQRDCDHVCNEADKATAQLISNDTKPCPSCGQGIHKIDGCDQMWCPDCKSAFSWRTGRIESNIHNPHYYEWMRRTGGEIPLNHNEVVCGREIDNYFARSCDVLLGSNGMFAQLRKPFRDACRLIIHYRFAELPIYRTDVVINNQDLRIKYLMNELTEDEFKFILQKNDKKNRKKKDIYNVLILFVNTSTDILFRFANILKQEDFIETVNEEQIQELMHILDEINKIIDYCNECCEKIGKAYNSKPVNIRKWFSVYNNFIYSPPYYG